MARRHLWKSEWVLGVIVARAVVVLSAAADLVESLERKTYDLGVRASGCTPSDRIAVIAIDDGGIANIGRWLWPRGVHAALIVMLLEAHAKVIAYPAFLAEPQLDPGLPCIDIALNTDRKLADSASRAGSVVLPVLCRPGVPLGRPDRDLSDYERNNALVLPGEDRLPEPAASNPAIPDRLVAVMHRALAKQTQERDETGEETARVIRECARSDGRRGREPAAVRG